MGPKRHRWCMCESAKNYQHEKKEKRKWPVWKYHFNPNEVNLNKTNAL